jgi:hypothetical protein
MAVSVTSFGWTLLAFVPGGAVIVTVAFKYRSPRPNALRNGTSNLSSGMENCACRDIAVDANGGRNTRFSIGGNQRIDVCGGQFHVRLPRERAPRSSSYQAFANLGAFSLGVATLVSPGVAALVSVGAVSGIGAGLSER